VAIDHYVEVSTKGNESCVEFCDKAIELILKAKVNDIGESIYVKVGKPRTVDIKEALRRLGNKGIKIPEDKKLIKIHTLRNPTHHIGETVSRVRTKSVLRITYEFIRRFLKDGFNLELRDMVKAEYYEVLERNISKTGQYIKYTNKAETKLYRIDEARSDVLKDYGKIEIELNRLVKKLNLQQPRKLQPLQKNPSLTMSNIVNALISNKKLPRKARRYFATISTLADKVSNTQEKITRDEQEKFVLAMMKFKVLLEKLS
jgi:hypothetical protein